MASPASVWEDPQCAFRIEWTPEKLDQIRIAAVDAFYALPRGGLEIGGILLGNFDGRLLRIQDWAAMECEHLTGPSFVLSARDEEALRAQLAGLSRQVVGWFHSHTRSDILFSAQDLAAHEAFFPKPWQIGLVLRPAHMQPLRANYFFRDKTGAVVPGGGEFSIDAARGLAAAGVQKILVAPAPESRLLAVMHPVPAAAEEPKPAPLPPPDPKMAGLPFQGPVSERLLFSNCHRSPQAGFCEKLGRLRLFSQLSWPPQPPISRAKPGCRGNRNP